MLQEMSSEVLLLVKKDIIYQQKVQYSKKTEQLQTFMHLITYCKTYEAKTDRTERRNKQLYNYSWRLKDPLSQ